MTSEERNARMRERYANDAEFRERVLERGRQYTRTPEGHAKREARKQRWRAENRERYLEQCRRQNERRRLRPEVMADNRRRVAEWQKKNPGRVLDWKFRANFGIGLQDYVSLLRAQRGRCAICCLHETSRRPNGKRKRLAVDHCHSSGAVRGLLCQRCNHTLGRMGDDPALLRRAAEYLEVDRSVA